MGGDNFAYVRRGRRGGSMKSIQVRTRGEGGPKLAILLGTYFLDAP